MLKAISPQARIPVAFPNGDDSPVTTFYIRPLTPREIVELKSMNVAEDDLSRVVKAVDFGLTGWENFEDAEWHADDQKANCDQIPWPEFLQIAATVLEHSRLTDELLGNSSSPSSTA